MISSFFFNRSATTQIYTLSLHDALPIYQRRDARHERQRHAGESNQRGIRRGEPPREGREKRAAEEERDDDLEDVHRFVPRIVRSEEHTSELQSQSNLVCRLLLEKKKKKK